MRPAVQSITPEEDDRSLLELGAVIMTGVAERSSPYAGRMQCLVILYEKFGQLIVKQKDGNLVLTVEREDAPQTLLDIIKSFDWTEA